MVRGSKPKRRKDGDDGLPPVFRDMLAETTISSPVQTDDEGKTVKRRRIGGRIITKLPDNEGRDTASPEASINDDDHLSYLFDEPISTKRPEVIRSDSEESAESDMIWEEVDLQHQEADSSDSDAPDDENHELHLVLGSGGDGAAHTPKSIKRRPMPRIDKNLRLDVHKLHLCCLLVHVSIRNHWCNDEMVHRTLRGVLSKKIVSYLNPSDDKSQFQRSRSFMDGLEQASESFRNNFRIVARGMCRPTWAESPEALANSQPPTDIDLPMQKADFQAAAQDMKASRDVGAQLFCALLRFAGVDARLVCSLQVLPFGTSTPSVAKPPTSYAAYYSTDQRQENFLPRVDGDLDNEDNEDSLTNVMNEPLGGRARFQSNTVDEAEVQSRKNASSLKHQIRESKYPVYWVEAFNEASQKWVSVDPLVTMTIAKPSKFEPPAGDRENSLTYVVAFEDDGSARDVTRRYAKAYNAKTRRDRVESIRGGENFWTRVMKMYRRSHSLDRDQVDDAELAKKEAAEPMPRNVQDFKDHPYYALERHLRRHEVIHPKREVGKVAAGRSGGTSAVESIYRRRDVHNVQSADKWYRSMGREIKPGEQPLKRVPARRTREQSTERDGNGDENAGTALYAIPQTSLYTAAPVVNGRISKNVYGNLDVYVPSMIPSGGIHIKHPKTIRAAKILGIDFAEAVTGFAFKGRHGTAITKGAVVALEHGEAVKEVIAAFENERVQAEEERRSHEAMRMWKRFLAGLRIRERIEGYTVEGERDTMPEMMTDTMDEAEDEADGEGGGFFPGQEVGDIAEPTARRVSESQSAAYQEDAGGFMLNHADAEEPDTEGVARDRFLDDFNEDDGGGFLVDDDHDEDAEPALLGVARKSETIQGPLSTPSQLGLQSPLDFSHSASNIAVEERRSADESGGDRKYHFTHDMTQEELDEARLLQELHEKERRRLPLGPAEEVGTSVLQTAETDHNIQSEVEGDLNQTSPNTQGIDVTSPTSPSTNTPSQPKTPRSDKGSLLSEDPDDEDAEPDWLA